MTGRAVKASLGLATSVAAWSLTEPHLRVLRQADVRVLPAGSQPLRVLHLSDLHLLPRHRARSAWVRGLARLRPDLVVSTGDHLSSPDAIPLLTVTLAAFDAPRFFVPGNNDYYLPRPPSVSGYVTGRAATPRGRDMPWSRAVAALEAEGWSLLSNARTTVTVAGQQVVLTGTDDAHLRRDRYEAVAGPVEGIGIGVTHTPSRRVLDAMAADGHRLLLAGHTHGGQVRLPGVGALVTNSDLDRSRARGLSRHGPAWLHVSAGLGTSPYAPVRLCCRPEATLLTLLPVG